MSRPKVLTEEEKLKSINKSQRKHDAKRAATRAKNRTSYLIGIKRKYGLTKEEYESMLIDQKHQCKICGTKTAYVNNPDKGFAVDHCHRTGKVRGLLCMKCNTGLGMFTDDCDKLSSAISYLMENK